MAAQTGGNSQVYASWLPGAQSGRPPYTVTDRLGSVVFGVWASWAPSNYGTDNLAQPPWKSRRDFDLQVAAVVDFAA